jgi:hypothetical protein
MVEASLACFVICGKHTLGIVRLDVVGIAAE